MEFRILCRVIWATFLPRLPRASEMQSKSQVDLLDERHRLRFFLINTTASSGNPVQKIRVGRRRPYSQNASSLPATTVGRGTRDKAPRILRGYLKSLPRDDRRSAQTCASAHARMFCARN